MCHLGKIIDNPQDIANTFNTYFIYIGPSIAEQIHSRESHKTYLKASHSSTLTLANIDEGYVASLLIVSKIRKAVELTNCLTNISKLQKNVMAKPLTLMINQMLNTGIFPDKFKQSKVTPIFKANDKKLLSNYRPISVLSSVSKLNEYAISDQLTQYLIDNNLFCSNQYGFRAPHSTELAALNIVDRLTYLVVQGIVPMNIYINLSKAFHTLNLKYCSIN